MQFSLPLIVEHVLDVFDGKDPGPRSDVRALIYDYGAGRARTGLSPEQFVRITVWTRSDIIRLLLQELESELDAETRLALMLGVGDAVDELTTAAVLGFINELAVRAAEDDRAFGQLLRTAHAGIAIGDSAGHVIYTNDTFARWFVRRDREPIGALWSEAFTIPDLDTVFARCEEGTEIWHDVTAADEFGTSRRLRISLRRHGGRMHAVAVDVSHQVEFEEMRREFIRGLIHDIRAPLTLVSGWASTLLQSSDRLDDDTKTKALESITKAAHQVRDLTDHLLELELLEGGEHTSDPITFAAGERVNELLGDSDPDLVSVVSNGSTSVHCDLDAFDRTISNLVANAFSHGTVPVQITLERHRDELRIDVRDNGSVDPLLIERAFEGRVKSSKGFGIGLRVTRLLVEAIGGRLELTSSNPTEFSVWVPMASDA